MAIQFARVAMVKRSSGANACRKGAYNARSKIVDEKTGEVFDFRSRGDNVHHTMLESGSGCGKMARILI